MNDTTNYPLEDMILALRALAGNYSDLCSVALQLVPDDENLPGDLLAIWDKICQVGNAVDLEMEA
jgi:hypothetical protein